MTDVAIENAVSVRDEMAQKIAAAEVQIKEWRAKKDRAERFILDWEEFSGQKAPAPAADTVADTSPTQAPAKKPKNPKKEDVAAAARVILLEKGVPMSRDELFAALDERGVVIYGGVPEVVLQTMLWRMSHKITHIKGFGYWPKDVPNAVAGYTPLPPLEDDDPVVRDVI